MASQRRMCKHAPEDSCIYIKEAAQARMMNTRDWGANLLLMMLTLITFGISSSDSPGWFSATLVMLLSNICAASSKKSNGTVPAIAKIVAICIYSILALIAFAGMTDILFVRDGVVYFIDNEYFHGIRLCTTLFIYIGMGGAFAAELLVYALSFLSFRNPKDVVESVPRSS